MGNFSNYWDLTTLFTKLKNKLKSISDKIDDSVSLKTATGNPITLTDAANANAEELLMTIEPIQSGSGDPSPTNIRPISGLTSGEVTRVGKNLFGNLKLNKSISQATGEDIDDPGGFRMAGKIRTDGYNAITLTFLGSEYKGSFIVLQYSESGYIGVVDEIQCAQIQYPYNRTLTLNPETTYIRIKGWYGTNISSINTAQFQVTLGSTASAYEPYTAATATITFGQTVYGGSVNFKTGEVTVTHGMVDLGTLTWVYNTSGGFSSDTLTDIKTGLCDLVCSELSLYPNSFIWGDIANIPNYSIAKNAGNKDLYVKDTEYTNAAAFKTAMSGVQLCYELATPITLTLTPAELELLKGNNTITANGAEISIEYYPDNAIGTLAGRVDDKADITYVDNITSDVQAQIDKIKNKDLLLSLNDFTNNGAKTIYESVLAYINSLSASDKPIRNVSFYITYNDNTMPRDLPASTIRWNYSYGEIMFRHNQYVDATIILYPFSTADDASPVIKHVFNGIQGTWHTVLTDKSGATKAYVDDLIKTEYVSSVISSMTGNSYTTVSIPLTIPNGYVAIGCLQAFTSTEKAAVTGNFIYAAGSTLRIICVNLYNADLSNVSVGATVIYIRS